MIQFPGSKTLGSGNQLPGQGRKVQCKFYHTNLWRKASEAFAANHPFCQECERNGFEAVPGKVTDHIKPINPQDPFDTKGGLYGEPLDEINMQRLCISCHARKSAKER